jgi:hypothetical protein
MLDEYRKMERFCLEQAALCTLREAREALEKVALDYRTAAEERERQFPKTRAACGR